MLFCAAIFTHTISVAYSWFVGEDFGCAALLVEGVVGVAVDVTLAHEVDARLGVVARP